MKHTIKIYLTAISFILAGTSAIATEISVKKTKGNTSYVKFKNAISKAKNGDEILVDLDITFSNKDPKIAITKHLTIKGAQRKNKFSLLRESKFKNTSNSSILAIHTDNFHLENLIISIKKGQGYKAIEIGKNSQDLKLYQNFSFKNCDFLQSDVHYSARGLFFQGKFKNVLIENCKFNYWFSIVARDCPVLDGFRISHCEFFNGSHQISFDGALLDEPDPTYGLEISLEKHENIIIENNRFNLTESFNIALAYTKNVIIRNNILEGGSHVKYSQPIHLEDRCSNIEIIGNTMKSKQTGILLFSTGKVGHGQGKRFEPAIKKTKGTGNVRIINNTIDADGDAISSTYLNGYLIITEDNTINGKKRGININQSFTSNPETKVKIDSKVLINGLPLHKILNIKDPQKRTTYLKSDIEFQ